MIDNKPEATEQPKQERIISLGEEFHLFDPQYKIQRQHSERFETDGFVSTIILNVKDVKIPIDINALASIEAPFSATPFDPEIGYQITPEDFTPDRDKKIEGMYHQLEKAPLELYITSDPMRLNQEGLNKKIGEYQNQFSSDMLGLLNKLRILLIFPTGAFEAKPEFDDIARNLISFFEFYPVDSGHLYSIFGENGTKWEGVNLFLPSDPEKLAQIRARFVMVDEQPDENPNNQAPNTK